MKKFLIFIFLVGCGELPEVAKPGEEAKEPITSTTETKSEKKDVVVEEEGSKTAVVVDKNTVLIPASNTVTVIQGEVTPNHPPVIVIEDHSVLEGQTLTINYEVSDPDGDPLTVTCSDCLSEMVMDAHTIVWTPDYFDAGVINLTLIADDGEYTTTKVSVITVINVNRSPVLNPISSQTIGEGGSVVIIPEGSDPDGDSTVISLVSELPLNTTWVSNVLTFNPSFSQSGQYEFQFQISDGHLVANESVTITVSNTNRAPVLDPIGSKTVAEDSNLNFSVSGSDPDGSSVSVTTSTLPTGATFTSNTFNWIPMCDQEGSYNVLFTLSDGSLVDTEEVVITVSHTNCYPPSWSGYGTSSLYSGNGTQTAVIDIGQAFDPYDTSLSYGFVREYDCNNINWTDSFNLSTRRLTVTKSAGVDWGTHFFLVYVQDSDGAREYKFTKLTCTVNSTACTWVVDESIQGGSYSTSGLCGAGTVYSH